MKELKLEYLKNNSQIIKQINEDINIIEFENSLCVQKRIIIPFKYETLKKQHEYINYLWENGINTAKILGIYKTDNELFEIQEYIDNDLKDISTEDLIKLISKYHYVSSKYDDNLSKDNVYNYSFQCRNTQLNHLLLGFNEKYYTYPKNNLKDKYSVISDINYPYILKISEIHDKCYKKFILDYNYKECIIHNDITSNNVISNNNKLYLIDFDLAIKSSIYVDFVDGVIKRYHSLKELYDNFESLKHDIMKYVEIYNMYNDNIKIDYNGVLLMMILKIVSFNLYVLLSKENEQLFNNSVKELYAIIDKIDKEINYDKKSTKRRCR